MDSTSSTPAVGEHNAAKRAASQELTEQVSFYVSAKETFSTLAIIATFLAGIDSSLLGVYRGGPALGTTLSDAAITLVTIGLLQALTMAMTASGLSVFSMNQAEAGKKAATQVNNPTQATYDQGQQARYQALRAESFFTFKFLFNAPLSPAVMPSTTVMMAPSVGGILPSSSPPNNPFTTPLQDASTQLASGLLWVFLFTLTSLFTYFMSAFSLRVQVPILTLGCVFPLVACYILGQLVIAESMNKTRKTLTGSFQGVFSRPTTQPQDIAKQFGFTLPTEGTSVALTTEPTSITSNLEPKLNASVTEGSNPVNFGRIVNATAIV